MSLGTVLHRTAMKHGSKTAIVYATEKLTYGEWDERSHRLANALTSLGIDKGDRVVILLPTSIEFMVSYVGVISTGAWATPIDVRFSIDELDFLFQDCQPKALISIDPYLRALAPLLSRHTGLKHVISLSPPPNSSILSYQKLLADAPARAPRRRISEGDICHLRYSSGTTGKPKGALASNSSEEAGARMGSQAMGLSETSVFVMPLLPPSWFLYMVAYVTYVAGAAVVAAEPGLDNLLQTITRYKGTAFMNIPPVLTEMLNMPEETARKYDLSSLKTCIVSGMPLRHEVARQFQERFGISPVSFLGYTETACGPAIQPLDGSGKPGATGKMLPGWEYKIVDESGQALPPDHLGELVFRSPALVSGYYNRPQATAEAFHDGWFSSGDMGRIDEDGFLFLSGRKKEIISLNGKEVFPLDVEEAVLANPKVAEVAAAEIPGKTGKGALKLAVVLKKGVSATAREIDDFCQQRAGLAAEEVEFLNALPRTPSGKVRRTTLKGVA
ncbi:MAG: acyl--CoA ligase [Chloroflexi bacterium]|nr:acyl--CoA ligase [Chloroflexota bacterium]